MTIEAIQVQTIEVAGQQQYGRRMFPLALACCPPATLDGVCAWIAENRRQLCDEAALHGAILFRGFPLDGHEDFDRFVKAFDLPNFPYEDSLSNAVRIVRTPRVFTANEAPPAVRIFLHHEMAQTPIYPGKLFFFCEQPAESGGATPLCRSDVLWDRLSAECPGFARSCESKGLRYSNVMPSQNDPGSGMGRSWQSTLRASRREQAEERLAALGYSWTWLTDGCLRATTPVLPATRKLDDGRTSFFNQLIAAFQGWKDERNDPSTAITFGDGTPLDRGAVDVATRLGEELSFDLAWQRSDVALVDNYVTMHGRRPFTGTRKVLASLVAGEQTGAGRRDVPAR
jgi:alpha-ketoglutarate-dependent taurine dioxygenase